MAQLLTFSAERYIDITRGGVWSMFGELKWQAREMYAPNLLKTCLLDSKKYVPKSATVLGFLIRNDNSNWAKHQPAYARSLCMHARSLRPGPP